MQTPKVFDFQYDPVDQLIGATQKLGNNNQKSYAYSYDEAGPSDGDIDVANTQGRPEAFIGLDKQGNLKIGIYDPKKGIEYCDCTK